MTYPSADRLFVPAPPVRVALVSEGTYPFAMGGVSVWCDQLMRGLDDHRFEFVALTVDRSERALWPAPPNLGAVHVIPLWTPSQPRRRGAGVDHEAVARLHECLVRPVPEGPGDAVPVAQDLLDTLRDLGACARAGRSTAGLLTGDRSVRALTDSWRRATGTRLTLRDALDWCELLEHLLRPLAETPVEADVVHSAMNGPSMLVGMAAHWVHGTPVVLSEHGIYLRERYLLEDPVPLSPAVRFLRLTFFRLLATASYQLASAVAPHSRYNRRWQLRCGAAEERLHTMYNGVALASFPAAPEPDVPTVSFLGRIDPVKDVLTLVSSFATVHAAVPEARLRIFGAAPTGQEDYLASCQERVAELGLTQVVTFEGSTRQPSDAYHGGSVVALSSISEGFPYSIVEAMACGRPVVCTNVGGVAEAVGDAGVVVPPQDPEALGHALVGLLLDDERRIRLGRAARVRVQTQFTVDRWTGAYADLYALVLDTTTVSGGCAPAEADQGPPAAERQEEVLSA